MVRFRYVPDPSGIQPLKLPDATWIFYRNETGLIADDHGEKQAEDPPAHRFATYHHDIFGMLIGGEARDDATAADPDNIRLGARCGMTFEKDNERARGVELDGGRMVLWARGPDDETDAGRLDALDIGTTGARFGVPIYDRFGRELLAGPPPDPGEPDPFAERISRLYAGLGLTHDNGAVEWLRPHAAKTDAQLLDIIREAAGL